MNDRLSTWYMLVLSAARNIVSRPMKSVVVGSILVFGAFLVVVGTSLLTSIETSMERTVTASLTGHLQLYSSEGEEALTLIGGGPSGSDFGEIRDFERIRKPVEALDNVRAVVPMGLTTARVVARTRLDEMIASLRDAVRREDWETVEQLRTQLTATADQLRKEVERRGRAQSDAKQFEASLESLDRLQSDAFWESELRDHPTRALRFLDTDIAPLATKSGMTILRLLGTAPHQFAEHFDRFQVEEGQMIPRGERGVMVSLHNWEHGLKHPVARGLDTIRETLDEEETTIAESVVIQSTISEMKRDYRTVFFGLPPKRTDRIAERLRSYLDQQEGDLESLLKSFLSVDDENFSERYRFFYDRIAPLIELYEFEIGDEITVQTLGQGGFTRSANVKVWGVYSFQGLEDLELAGSMTLTDLVTFRNLYGVMDEETRRELEEIRREADLEEIDRHSAEEALFGDSSDEAAPDASTETDDPFAEVEAELESSEVRTGLPDSFDPERLQRGLVRNAAVVLESPSDIEETRRAIEEVVASNDLDIAIAGWKSAAGIIGQFVTVIRGGLVVSLVVIFLVALVIINNSMVMATVERTEEIGTMRAIGAQRGYVAAQFVLETVLLGTAAGIAGTALGAAAILVAGQTGIPASTEVLRFLFSGDYLYPTLYWWNLALGVVTIVAVAALSTLYPAVVATRVPPVVAMRGRAA